MTTHTRVATAEYSAPCLQSGPLADAGREATAAAATLGVGRDATAVRVRVVSLLFDGMEKAFASGTDPVPTLNELLLAAASYCRHSSLELTGESKRDGTSRDRGEVSLITGAHYGRLFREFSAVSYFDEPSSLLRKRLQRNAIPESAWVGKRVLDAGCGGGRYTVAWRMLGARSVTGVDVSESGIADARARVVASHINGVHFDIGDTLALPYADHQFDVVYSNGVLHHTVNWRAGIAEAVRVLHPGGLGWLYVIENPGGLFWDVIEILRVIMREDDREAARRALADAQVPANRIFYMLDHVMVPINIRLTPAEVSAALEESGAKDIRRLTRGADFDRVEQIFRGDPLAELKYGVGENRFVFTK
jgi:ubiquinone/menaquinone biosynthesis C-methylase UbiE